MFLDLRAYICIYTYNIYGKKKRALYILFSDSNFDYVGVCLVSLCKRTGTKTLNGTHST